jgi:hypothetical protein
MFEQISIFDLLTEQTESHFTAQIRRGSGFENGRVRIYCASCNLGIKELAVFLKDEYGVGGNSITFPDGQSGFADYHPAGIELQVWKTHEVEKHKWTEAAAEVKRLILSNDYLTEKDWQSVEEILEHFGTIPIPHPRMRVIPA